MFTLEIGLYAAVAEEISIQLQTHFEHMYYFGSLRRLEQVRHQRGHSDEFVARVVQHGYSS